MKITLLCSLVLLTFCSCLSALQPAIPSFPHPPQRHSLSTANSTIRSGQVSVLDYYLYLYYDEEAGYWQDYYRYFPEYTQDTLTVSLLVEEKNLAAGLWESYYNYHYTYNEANKLTYVLMQNRNGNLWEDDYSEIYAYDNGRQVSSYLLRKKSGNEWINELEIRYYYANDILIREEWKYFSITRDDTQYRALYEYNQTGKVTAETWEVMFDGVWYPYLKGEYQYNADNLIMKETWYDKVGEVWVYAELYDFFYENSKLHSISGFVRAEDGQSWVNSYKHNYLYDNDGSLNEYKYQIWPQEGWGWQNVSKYVYYRRIVTAIDSGDSYSAIGASNPVSVYPNPVSVQSAITIEFPEDVVPVNISFYDIKGRKIKSRDIITYRRDNIRISLPHNLLSGVYLLQVSTTQGKYSTRIFVLR